MAFRFCDSFDHYASSEISLKWTQEFGATIQSTIVRNGPNAMFFTSGLLNPAQVSKTLDMQGTWICGWAIYLPSSSSGLASGGTLYQLVNNGTTLMQVNLNADSTISLATPGGVFATTVFSLHFNVFYYFEISNVLSSSGSPATIFTTSVFRVNGVQLLAPGAVNTTVQVSSLLSNSAQANRHIFSGVQGDASGLYIDDLYICDGQGSANNNFLGDVAIAALYPDADVTTNWSISPSTPTTHYTHVNQEPPPGDSSYIFSDTTGQKDDFDWQPIPTFTGTIPAVHYLLYARKDDEGTRQIKHTIGGNTYPAGTGGVLGTPDFSLSDDYAYYAIPLDNDPAASGAAWTVSNFNAQDFGVLMDL